MWEKHCRSSEASGCEGSNILGKQREWQKIFPSFGRKYFRPVEANISLLEKRISMLCRRDSICVKKRTQRNWQKMYTSEEKNHFYFVEENISDLCKIVLSLEGYISFLWRTIFSFIGRKYFQSKRIFQLCKRKYLCPVEQIISVLCQQISVS